MIPVDVRPLSHGRATRWLAGCVLAWILGWPSPTRATVPSPSPSPSDTETLHTIDLPTALRLARVSSPRIEAMEAAIEAAKADLLAARVDWLPSIRLGASYHALSGAIQESSGNRISLQRSSAFAGLGVGAAAAGPVFVPGMVIQVDFASLIFDTLTQKQNVAAMKAATQAAEQDVTLDVALAYYDLVRQAARVTLAIEAVAQAEDLAKTVDAFATAGEGLQADAARTQVAAEMFRTRRQAAEGDLSRASARLATLLHLQQNISTLRPADDVGAITLVESTDSLPALIEQALQHRPEVTSHTATLEGAESSLRKARWDPLLPTLVATGSAGAFAADVGPNPGGLAERVEVGVNLLWDIEHLGAGHVATARRERARLRQLRAVGNEASDRITLEVHEAFTQADVARGRMQSTQRAITWATRAYELDRARIFANEGSPIEVLQSLETMIAVRLDHIEAVTAFNQAQHRLLWATAGP